MAGPFFSLHIDTARTWRGGQNQVLLTVLGLRQLGHRAALVAHPEGELRRRASEGADVIPLAPYAEMDLRAGWRLARVLKDLRPDVIHAHDPHAVAMAAVARSMGSDPCPPLIAGRRVDFRMKQNSFSRWKYRHVARFVCASNAIRQILIADGLAPDRVVTVYEGISLRHVAAAPPAELHQELWLPHGAPIVGNIAALVPHKGQRHLVDAAALVLREVPDAQFLIVGEGELRESIERQIKHLHLERHVHLLGFRPDPLSVLKGFDIFAMSSVTEGLGTSVLDAMAASKPVVATRAGGLPELVQDGRTGYLTPVRDARAMAEAIVKLLRDPALRTRLGEAGQTRVFEHFTVERVVEETVEVYRKVLKRDRT